MIDIANARALVKTLKDYAEHPSSFTDISPTEADAAADLIDALLNEVERLNSPVVLSEWEKLVDERERLVHDLDTERKRTRRASAPTPALVRAAQAQHEDHCGKTPEEMYAEQTEREQPRPAARLTVDNIWGNDEIMALNSRFGLLLLDLVALADAVQRAFAAKNGLEVGDE